MCGVLLPHHLILKEKRKEVRKVLKLIYFTSVLSLLPMILRKPQRAVNLLKEWKANKLFSIREEFPCQRQLSGGHKLGNQWLGRIWSCRVKGPRKRHLPVRGNSVNYCGSTGHM